MPKKPQERRKISDVHGMPPEHRAGQKPHLTPEELEGLKTLLQHQQQGQREGTDAKKRTNRKNPEKPFDHTVITSDPVSVEYIKKIAQESKVDPEEILEDILAQAKEKGMTPEEVKEEIHKLAKNEKTQNAEGLGAVPVDPDTELARQNGMSLDEFKRAKEKARLEENLALRRQEMAKSSSMGFVLIIIIIVIVAWLFFF